MRKWLPAVMIAAGLAAGAAAYGALPALVDPPWGRLVPWLGVPPGEPLPRAFVAFALPVVALVVWLLLLGLATPAAERLGRRVLPSWLVAPRTGAAAVNRFRPTYDIIVAAVVGLVLLMHVVTLGMALGWVDGSARAFGVLVGLGMILVGNVMPRTRPNWVAGLRTRRALSDPDVWRRTHRWFGGLLMVSGLAVVAVAFVATAAALPLALVASLASAVVATIVGARGGGSASANRMAALALVAIAGAAPAEAQEQRSFGYVWMVGQDTVGVERVTVQGSVWTSDVALVGQPRVMWTASFVNDRFGPVDVLVYRTPADTLPAQHVRFTAVRDTVHATVLGATPVEQRFGTRDGAHVLVPSSFTMTALLASSLRDGERTSVPVFLTAGARTIDLELSRTADTLIAGLAGVTVHIVTDGRGEMESATVGAQNLRVQRVIGAELARLRLGAPNYDAPPGAPYVAQHVAIPAPAGHTLAATFTRPAGTMRVPAVVTISGSGPQDRDEWIPIVHGYRPFRQLADTLGRRGIAVLRFDDRGHGSSTGDYATATTADFAEDVRAVVAWLRSRADVDPDRIFLVGHSEGAIIAPLVAVSDDRLAGIALLAGPAVPGRDIIHYQQRYAIERDTTLRPALARDSALHAARLAYDSIAAVDPWHRFFAAHDPLTTARSVRNPTLILHGATDRQVTADQAEILARAMRDGGNREVTVHVYEELNHLFVRDADGSPAGYGHLRATGFAPHVVAAIVDWLLALSQ